MRTHFAVILFVLYTVIAELDVRAMRRKLERLDAGVRQAQVGGSVAVSNNGTHCKAKVH